MKLRETYFKQQFYPGLLGIFINPFYFSRKGLLNAITKFAPNLKGRLLDAGCGQKPYQPLFIECEEYIGIEIDTLENRKNKKADYFYDGLTFPFTDESFDSIVCNQVLEHVFNPDQFLAEINRVTKSGGHLLLTVPFVWDEHEQPFDYGRYTFFGLTHLLNQHGFKIIESLKTQADVTLFTQLVNAYLYKVTITRNGYLNLLITVVLMAPFNLLGLILSKFLPRNPDLYLDNVVLAVKQNN